MKTVALYHVKGGVGKSTAAVNLAWMAAEAGIPTLLWDLDSQGASSWTLGGTLADDSAKKILKGDTPIGRLVRPTGHSRLSMIPASLSYRYLDILLRKADPPRSALKKLLKPFSESYSLAVLDCPPGLSNLADNVFEAADLILVPIVPAPLSLRAWEQLQHYLEQEGFKSRHLLPFLSMVDRRRSLHRALVETPGAAFPSGFAATIPYAASIERMAERREPVARFVGSGDPALQAFQALFNAMRSAMNL